jgi:hypothetical protein
MQQVKREFGVQANDKLNPIASGVIGAAVGAEAMQIDPVLNRVTDLARQEGLAGRAQVNCMPSGSQATSQPLRRDSQAAGIRGIGIREQANFHEGRRRSWPNNVT